MDQLEHDAEVGRLLREAMDQAMEGDQLSWAIAVVGHEEQLMGSHYSEDGLSDRKTALLDVARALKASMDDLSAERRRAQN